MSLSAECMCINYTTKLDCLAVGRGQAGVPAGLKSADFPAQLDQDTDIGLFGMRVLPDLQHVPSETDAWVT